MNTSDSPTGSPGQGSDELRSASDVRAALAGTSAHLGTDERADLDIDGYWARGRRRRTYRRAGVAGLAGLAGVTAGVLVWTSGLLGGETDPEPSIAAFPEGTTTFVFAADGPASDSAPDPAPAADVPDAAQLSGTSWVLLDDLWGSDRQAADVVGSSPQVTRLSFAAGDPASQGWGLTADDCGRAWFEDPLTLNPDGAFPAGTLARDGQSCPEPAAVAEDFWRGALEAGGTLHEVGDGRWLLLTLGPDLPPGQVAPTDPADPTDESTTDPTTDPPAVETDGTDSPDAATPDAGTGSAPPRGDSDPGPAFTAPDQEATQGDWMGGGGDLLAPTVRTGAHPGFDRIVVDLVGEGPLGWRAGYTDDPTLDGSGRSADLAGDQVLEVWLSGMGLPEAGSDVYDEGTLELRTQQLGAVSEVLRTTPFEGRLQVFVGVEGERKAYRVFELDGPHRLVIDVQH